MKNTFLKNTLADLEKNGLLRKMRNIEGAQGRKIIVDGKEVLNFCSNNYLGLADDSRLKQAAIFCMETQGFGSGASRLVCGNLSAHQVLEEKVARFKDAEKCITFSTGYMANVGIISGLFNRDDIIFSDRLNHASIVDGILLSKAAFKRYPHCDMIALEQMLKEAEGDKNKIIITDSVFSMDGDLAPLDHIIALAERYNCMVMVDDAHAVGVFGRKGAGLIEHLGLGDKVDIQMGTFSKAVGSFGAYCCGSTELIEVLINKARSFIYTTGLPPSVAAASCKGIEIIEQDLQLRERLWDNTSFMLKEIQRMGFDTLQTQSPIIPILIKDSELAVKFSRQLFDAGILIAAIRPPTVPQNTARLRVTVMATHLREDLEETLQQLKKTGKELCLL